MSTVLIVGSSRGLGLALVKYCAQIPQISLVLAGARSCSPALEETTQQTNQRVVFIPLDVCDNGSVLKSIEHLPTALQANGLDILINCAGVSSETHGKVAQMSDLSDQLSVNVVGAHNLISSYLPLLQKGKLKKVANISTIYSSLTWAERSDFAPMPAYKISKAALNALTVQYALSYGKEEFTFVAVHPGWLRTEMGGKDAHLSVEEGAEAVWEVISTMDQTHNGSFMNIHIPGSKIYTGGPVPW
ncbi:hydroxyacyl dehydrogenase [Penicillium angulare]|uniref:Hydroxyacyl dehydrogenase n=1 Tax=Penicillium angulare TaxID=116970 RepID=A0A9W9G9A7_9EURO|nr:hydroxyacyl dehydrogenase [Penicillium angulare]